MSQLPSAGFQTCIDRSGFNVVLGTWTQVLRHVQQVCFFLEVGTHDSLPDSLSLVLGF